MTSRRWRAPRRRGTLALGAALLALWAGCGDGTPEAASDATGAVEAAPAPSAAPASAPAGEVVRAPAMDGDVVLVGVQEVREKLAGPEPVLLIDARPTPDFLHEHIPGAVNVPLNKLSAASELPGVPRDREIVVYCIAPECPISKNAARVLARLGYVNVKDMREGLMGWKRAGFETARGGGA